MNFYHYQKERQFLVDFQLIGQNHLKESKYHTGTQDARNVEMN